jgi:hypothetical protein
MEEKKLEDMNVLELKGVLFNCTQQIQEIQVYMNTKIVPLIEQQIKKEKEEIKE